MAYAKKTASKTNTRGKAKRGKTATGRKKTAAKKTTKPRKKANKSAKNYDTFAIANH